MISLETLPQGYLNLDHSTGKMYCENDVQMIFSDEHFEMKLREEEEEKDYDELGFFIKRAINMMEREGSQKEKACRDLKKRLEKD